MTAIEDYNQISRRAWKQLHLHNGLINTRKRAMRTDWALRFCKLMHWNLASNIDRVDGRDAVLILRNNSKLTRDYFEPAVLDDMLRTAIVMSVSALDKYVHSRVVAEFVVAFRKGDLNKVQQDFSIPVELALKIAEKMRQDAKDGQQSRPANVVRNYVQEVVYKRPFQSWREIDNAMRLIGKTDWVSRIQTDYGLGDIADIKKQLGEIIQRRNYIVHEGDLVRYQRGGNGKVTKISPKYVEESLRFVDDFVDRLHKVAV